MIPSHKPVLIIGAGLSGLTLAQGLQRHSIPYILYERDASAYSRLQGYRIRIHGAGFPALQECLPPDVYKHFESTCGIHPDTFLGFGKFDARTGERIPSDQGPGPQRSGGLQPPPGPLLSLPVDRQVMRAALLQGIPAPIYEKSFQSYTFTSTGVIVHFSDGTSSPEGSLLVGADGIYSRVAHQLIGDAALPRDMGARMIYGKTPLVEGLEDRIHPEMRSGIHVAIGNGNTDEPLYLLMETMHFKHEGAPQDYIYWVLAGEPAAFDMESTQLTKLSSENAARLSKDVTREWSPLIKPIFEFQAVEQTAVLRMTTTSPASLPVWETNARVTVLGDAIHQMPPTGGSGANTALRDAALLSKLLSENIGEEGWSASVIREYEDGMREYAQDMVKRSYGNAVKGFGVKPFPDVTL